MPFRPSVLFVPVSLFWYARPVLHFYCFPSVLLILCTIIYFNSSSVAGWGEGMEWGCAARLSLLVLFSLFSRPRGAGLTINTQQSSFFRVGIQYADSEKQDFNNYQYYCGVGGRDGIMGMCCQTFSFGSIFPIQQTTRSGIDYQYPTK